MRSWRSGVIVIVIQIRMGIRMMVVVVVVGRVVRLRILDADLVGVVGDGMVWDGMR